MSVLFPFPTLLRSSHGRWLDLRRPQIMGILNLTPDSFHAGSRVGTEAEVLRRAEAMLAAGAGALDLGGYSTRPGADDISPDEEKARLLPALAAVRREFPHAFLSADTFRAGVAEAAVTAGADLINDVSGGTLDPEMLPVIARLGVAYGLMHLRGTPQTMTQLADYGPADADLLPAVLRHGRDQLAALRALPGGRGVDVLFDPGLGFAKTADQSHALLRRLPELAPLGCPLLVGLSRKRMVYGPLGGTAAEALNGTTALHMLALLGGARLLRVHDVQEAVEAVRLNEWVGFPHQNLQPYFQRLGALGWG